MTIVLIVLIFNIFFQMLKEGVGKQQSLPIALPRSETFPSAFPTLTTKTEDSEPEPEDYVPPPPKTSLGDALAHAFAQATTISGNGNSKSGKKKKMKGQKISLTGSARPMMD